MTTDIKELVKILRDRDGDWRLNDAADALEALAGEVERLKDQNTAWADKYGDTQNAMYAALDERDRLKAALEALEAVRSDLPEKVSEQWLYEGVRHWHRNCDWDEPRDGSPLDRGNGATVAKILNMIPRKALGGDA